MKDSLTLPNVDNGRLVRRKSARLRSALSDNLRNRIKQGLRYETNLAPLFLGLLNPYYSKVTWHSDTNNNIHVVVVGHEIPLFCLM